MAGCRGRQGAVDVLPIVGAHGRGGHTDAGRLELFDFETLRDRDVDGQCGRLRRRGRPRNGAGARRQAAACHRRRAASGPRRGEPKVATRRRARAAGSTRRDPGVDRTALEWRQMLREVWRLQRDQFWVPNMSGIDWPAIYTATSRLLDARGDPGELSDLIWEMQGELGTSHAYEMRRRPSPAAAGRARPFSGGAEALRADGKATRSARIVDGDAWDASADSPLNAVGVEARSASASLPSTASLSRASRPPQALLVHQAGMKVEL